MPNDVSIQNLDILLTFGFVFELLFLALRQILKPDIKAQDSPDLSCFIPDRPRDRDAEGGRDLWRVEVGDMDLSIL